MDKLVLNDDIKRRHGAGLECYNCGEEFFPELDQGFACPSFLNPENKEFCDVFCQVSFAKGQLDDFDWPDYYEHVCEFVGFRPFIPPPFTELQRFGGRMTIAEYKWGHHPTTRDASKRVKLDGSDEMNE